MSDWLWARFTDVCGMSRAPELAFRWSPITSRDLLLQTPVPELSIQTVPRLRQPPGAPRLSRYENWPMQTWEQCFLNPEFQVYIRVSTCPPAILHPSHSSFVDIQEIEHTTYPYHTRAIATEARRRR